MVREDLLEQSRVGALPEIGDEGRGTAFRDMLALAAHCGPGVVDRVAKIIKRCGFAAAQRLVRMGRIDQAGICAIGNLQFLQPLADHIDFRDHLLSLADPALDHAQFRCTVLDLALRPRDFCFDLADFFLGEAVD